MKLNLFIENTKLLYDKYKIIPLLYGSLGLEYITNENLCSDDIDILIPKVYLNELWDEFKNYLISNDYILYDEKEHSFVKNDVSYSYASIEELENFVDISINDIKQVNVGEISFKILSLKQYLKVYQTSIKDGYRVNIRQKKDNEKIELIKNKLKNTSDVM